MSDATIGTRIRAFATSPNAGLWAAHFASPLASKVHSLPAECSVKSAVFSGLTALEVGG